VNYSFQLIHQSLPLKQVFRIARGAKTSAEVLVLTLTDGQHIGWSEAVPYARYNESIKSVGKEIATIATELENGLEPQALQSLLPPGAARNLVDCALWDLKAKQQQQSVEQLLGLPQANACVTAQTLSIDTPTAMSKAAMALGKARLIKIKLDAEQVLPKMRAVHAAAPNSQFIVDANESWDFALLKRVADQLHQLNVVLIEQPLPASQDQTLADFSSPIPLCADESCHTSADIARLKGRYQAINIKLDKTGGLTEAVKLLKQAQQQELQIMTGCMVGSSLAMAPAFLLTTHAQFVDLDGPVLIANDKEQGFAIEQGVMTPTEQHLWGRPHTANQAANLW